MSRMRSTCAALAAGMACNTTSGAGGIAAFCCEHAAREIPNNRIDDTRRLRDLLITGPRLPHHRGNVLLRRPYQADDPSDYGPSQEKIEQENREKIPLTSSQGDDRRQKIHQERQAEEWEEQKRRDNHNRLPLIA